MPKVFISYRRDDAVGHAGRLYDRLETKFGSPALFYDRKTLKGGQIFIDEIGSAIRSARVVMAVIGPEWCNDHNQERLHHLDDVVRRELALALNLTEGGADTVVIPLLCGGATVPAATRLPTDLATLFDRHTPSLDPSAYDAGFDELCDRLKELGIEPTTLCSNNLRRATAAFVGRERELSQLDTAIDATKIGVITAVHGFGGMGKTELAVRYAETRKADYPGGRWLLGAEGKKELLPLLGELALDLNLPESAGPSETGEQRGRRVLAELHKRARDGRGPCLLMLDNVSESTLLSRTQLAHLPQEDWYRMVVTTRLDTHTLGNKALEFIPVDSLPEPEALELIRRNQPGEDWPTATAVEDEAAARELVHELGGFTLAVEAVAVYLGQHPEIRPAAYLKRLRREGLISVDDLGTDPDVQSQLQHREKQLALILDVTLERLTEIDREALAFAALLPPDSIPWLWLRDLLTRTHSEALQFEEGYPDPWIGIRQRLEGSRLLTPGDQDGVARLHRMVGAHLRDRNQGRSYQLRDALVDFMEVFGTYFEHTWEHNPRILWILKPFQETISYLSQEGADERLAKQAGVVGTVEMSIGRFSSAFAYLSLSHQIFKQLRAEQPDSETLSRGESAILNSLADFMARRGLAGDAEQALADYQRALEVRERLLAANPESAQAARDVLITLERLAKLTGEGEGEEVQKEALDYQMRSLQLALQLHQANQSSYHYGRTAAVSFFLTSQRAQVVGATDLANQCLGGCHKVLHDMVTTGIQLDPGMAGLYEQLNAAVDSSTL